MIDQGWSSQGGLIPCVQAVLFFFIGPPPKKNAGGPLKKSLYQLVILQGRNKLGEIKDWEWIEIS